MIKTFGLRPVWPPADVTFAALLCLDRGGEWLVPSYQPCGPYGSNPSAVAFGIVKIGLSLGLESKTTTNVSVNSSLRSPFPLRSSSGAQSKVVGLQQYVTVVPTTLHHCCCSVNTRFSEGSALIWRLIANSLIEQGLVRICMVRRATARGSLAEKTSLRQCIRPLCGDRLSWPR